MIFIDAHGVADRLGYANDLAFLRQRHRLERDEGFPPPMPTQLRPLKWRADAVEAWVEAQGTTTPPDYTPTPGSNVVLLREART